MKWTFLTVAPTEEAKKTWGNDSWRTGGGGGWMPGTYDGDTNTLYWGTANPAPLYDWSGADWKTAGARPGDNLYTTSVIGLDLDTGNLKFYHQELPHDAWDFDSAVGEFVLIDRDGQKYVVHPNKGGYIFVYDRDLKVKNVYPHRQQHQLRQDRSIRRPASWSAAVTSAPASRPSRCARRSTAASVGTRGATIRGPASTTRSATNGASAST